MKSTFIYSVIIVFLSVQLFSCGGNDQAKNNQGGPGGPGGFGGPARVVDYKVLTLAPQQAKVNADFPATIQGQQVIEIRPKVDGYVETIYVNEGATVKKGQLLFKISNPQYEQDVITANASIKSAEADVDAAKMQVEKVKPLVEKDIVSKYELESAQYTLKAKEAALAQAKASLSNAETNVGYTVLRAPVDGVIGLIPYKVGALVNSSSADPLTTLSNTDKIWAYYSLNEKQLLDFFANIPGQTMQQKVNNMAPATLLLADGTVYPEKGKIEIASGIISTETGSVTFKAIYSNPLGIIRSGASATVRIPRVIDSTLIVPQSSTYELQDKRMVYVVNKDNQVSSVAITSVPSDNGQYFIVTGGLKPGDTVVLEGLIGLRDNMKIIPKQASADSVYAKLK
ncbi:MAG TPA: efflux RND transporter periplasmic adaptor subunit [Chitinophagaceae bacterium]|nr:efflux RND transporter periplasmic adaptor subunit [Chitinophagaceae bacterium]